MTTTTGLKGRYPFFSVAAAVLLVLGLAASAARAQSNTLSGTVINKTSNKPAAGEEVVLMSLAQGMQEVAHTKADGKGHYSFDLPDAGMHLLRVDHEKTSYYASVPAATTTVDVSIYDVAAKLKEISTKAEMVRVETDKQQLHIVQSYFVENDSLPARTQIGPEGYTIYLPKGAQIDASEAMSPGGMPIASPPDPVGDKGGYSFSFPLRPGETRFEVSYHLPYSGSYSYKTTASLDTANFAVAVAKGMTFQADSSEGFQSFSDEADSQTYLKKDLKTLQTISFTIGGSGSFPAPAPDAAQGQDASGQSAPAAPASEAVTPADNKPGMGLGPPSGEPGPVDKYKWWILCGFALLLAAGAGIMLRPRTAIATQIPTSEPLPAPVAGDSLLAVLKEELFALETERLRGTVTDSEYSDRKNALETVLKHAITRK